VIDDPESIIRCGNKVYLFELAKRLDLAIPPTMVVSSARTDEIIRELQLPCVLKQPDSAFSEGVFRVDTREALSAGLQRLLSRSDLVIVQSFMPTEFDWRVGVLDRQPLFVCRYYMADGHWQILNHDERRTERRPRRSRATRPRRAPARCGRQRVGDGLRRRHQDREQPSRAHGDQRQPDGIAASRMRCSATALRAGHEGVQSAGRCRQAIQTRRLSPGGRKTAMK
jgi:hypothetical protein